MATGTAGSDAYRSAVQTVNYKRKRITFTAAAGTYTYSMGKLPAGTLLLGPVSGIQVVTAFDSGTSALVDIGITGTVQKYASAMDVKTAVAFLPLDVATAVRVLQTEEEIIVTVVLTGSSTAGEIEAVLVFIGDLDN